MMQAVHSSLCLNRVFLYGWLTAAGVPCDFASVAGEHVGFPVKCPGLQPVMGQGSPTSHCADFLRDACSCCLHARATHATEQHEALVCVCVCVLAMPGVCGAIAGCLCRTCRACPSCFSFFVHWPMFSEAQLLFSAQRSFSLLASGKSRGCRSSPAALSACLHRCGAPTCHHCHWQPCAK